MGASASTAVAALEQELELLTSDVEFAGDGKAGEEAWQRLFRTIHQLPPKPHLRQSDVEQATHALCLRMSTSLPFSPLDGRLGFNHTYLILNLK